MNHDPDEPSVLAQCAGAVMTVLVFWLVTSFLFTL